MVLGSISLLGLKLIHELHLLFHEGLVAHQVFNVSSLHLIGAQV